ncbi:hypothetical protein ACWGS9_30130 [Bradyrhizobium sp. Arg314]
MSSHKFHRDQRDLRDFDFVPDASDPALDADMAAAMAKQRIAASCRRSAPYTRGQSPAAKPTHRIFGAKVRPTSPMSGIPIEALTWRLSAIAPNPDVKLRISTPDDQGDPHKGFREVGSIRTWSSTDTVFARGSNSKGLLSLNAQIDHCGRAGQHSRGRRFSQLDYPSRGSLPAPVREAEKRSAHGGPTALLPASASCSIPATDLSPLTPLSMLLKVGG